MDKTKTTDPAALRAEADRLHAAAAEKEAAIQAIEQAERDRRLRAQAEWDKRLVESWDQPAHDRAVAEAEAALEAVLRDDPIVAAVANLRVAQGRRRWLKSEIIAAVGRGGRDTTGAVLPDPPATLSLSDYVARTAEQLADETLAVERQQLNEEREQQ